MMKIERIDDKTVKCFLSNDELDEYEISYRDFVMRSQKARNVLRYIIEQAQEEVGYHPPQYALDIQIMMVPEQGMVLTFSDGNSEEEEIGKSLASYLKGVVQRISREQGIAENPDEDTEEDDAPEESQSDMTGEDMEEEDSPAPAVFKFNAMRDVCKYASSLPENLSMNTALYKSGDFYYLQMSCDDEPDVYTRCCIQAMEFASLCCADQEQISYMEEQAECLITDHALEKLRM